MSSAVIEAVSEDLYGRRVPVTAGWKAGEESVRLNPFLVVVIEQRSSEVGDALQLREVPEETNERKLSLQTANQWHSSGDYRKKL
jgi:hypothetical protein